METFFNWLFAGNGAVKFFCVFVLPAMAICAAVWGVRAMIAARKKRELDGFMRRRYAEWRGEVERRGGIDPRQVSLMLDDGEEGYLQMSATLCEPRSVRESVHSGGAVHIARGVTIGQGRTTSKSHDEWTPIAKGRLIVTSRRVVFDGDMHNREIPLAKVLSVQASATQVAISSTSQLKTMLFDGVNGLIVRDVITLVKGAGD